MILLLFRQFLRTRTCQLGIGLIVVLALISIAIGKQFLMRQSEIRDQVIVKQKEHIERNIAQHGDDLGLLLYYLEFSIIHEINPLAGLSIGQQDVHPSAQSLTIRTLEGQKHDTDLINPYKLLFGNLDLSFIIIYAFPLLVIAFAYNTLSEEEESGTWKMVRVMSISRVGFLLSKLLVRFSVLSIVMCALFATAVCTLDIDLSPKLWGFVVISLLYLLFWFALSFWIVSLQQSSNFNALILLTIWLVLVILLPSFVNNLVIHKHPIPEALTAMITQRDGYHTKWDTNKKETMTQFYDRYPQLETFGYPPEQGFTWLWYYAMQHLGDEESRQYQEDMQDKIEHRVRLSERWARFVPAMHTQLAFNSIAGTGLKQQSDFLRHISSFHEKTRLYFYPLIFTEQAAEAVDWEQFQPEILDVSNPSINWYETLLPLALSITCFVLLSMLTIKKLI